MDRIETFVAVALGSNLGDRRGHIEWALDQLARVIGTLTPSTLIETDPVGLVEVQPPYLNAVAVGQTPLDAKVVLATLHELEALRGRVRSYRWAPRTLDLDLILWGDAVINEPDIVVPHPRFRERRFVLEPLVEVAPDARDPVTGKTARQLLAALSAGGV